VDLEGTDNKPTHTVQSDVEDFHRSLDITVGTSPALREPELRAELIREEAKETIKAIEENDLVLAIDGLCDLLAVVYGSAVTWGVDLAPFWDEVHKTNMLKQGGLKRADGKRLKPPGWKPPELEPILEMAKKNLR
jgi:predicted HAD superfamily Cof-like phosphohydrolase